MNFNVFLLHPENVHNLNKRAIIYYVLRDYDKALLDIDKVIQLDISNILVYYYKQEVISMACF
ncbi:hypothetical protein RhiirA5_424681 [Rhizophagus irregularis]|uniref:Uncharacterized protein n=1 Tax=Rhizophagus irregularis TaxID=588596 RepID=A0A2I1F745_9GLOM|nr:hypothetical protein RhiirA5_424681 [Rhizophagus irregularis]PKY30196.1 hypothetical protein RhiirB3_447152 [Rhizophagus irregularis]GBC30937.2 hypothetical protein GLOIN_2v1871094 [Rhizophagus irregularis DAOM 181602=DAOM 197198]